MDVHQAEVTILVDDAPDRPPLATVGNSLGARLQGTNASPRALPASPTFGCNKLIAEGFRLNLLTTTSLYPSIPSQKHKYEDASLSQSAGERHVQPKLDAERLAAFEMCV